MTATGNSGLLMFGLQTGNAMGAQVANWHAHRMNGVNLAVGDESQVMPNEVGGRPLPGGAYKGGVSVGGGVQFTPRLEGTLGVLLYALMGAKTAVVPAIVDGHIMSATPLTVAIQTIVTGLGAPPIAGAKLAVRILKADTNVLKPTITIVGTDQADAVLTETFNFDAALGAGQRAIGLDTDPASGTGYEEIVSGGSFKTITSIALPAYPDAATDPVKISVGMEDAIAKSVDFNLDESDPNLALWMGLRKLTPKGKNGAPLGEQFNDCKLVSFGLTLPNNGPIVAEAQALGRTFGEVTDPFGAGTPWGAVPVSEVFDSIPISSVIGGYLKAPQFDGEALPVVNARVTWVNAPLDQRVERVFGSPYLDDVTVTGRQMVVEMTVKWANPDLYRAVLTGSKVGTEWSSTPFTTRMDILTKAPSLIPGSLAPYSLRIQAQRVMLGLRGGIQLAADQAVLLTFAGVVLDVGGTYAKYTLTNTKADAFYA